jgi:potassium-dependent mechanosensitive channel
MTRDSLEMQYQKFLLALYSPGVKVLPGIKVLLATLLFQLLLSAASAQSALTDFSIIRDYTEDVNRAIANDNPNDATLIEYMSASTRYRSVLARCVQETKTALEKRTEKIQAVEDNVEALDSTLQENAALQLQNSRADQAQASKKLVECQLLEQRVGDLINALSAIQSKRLLSNIQFREKDGFDTTVSLLNSPSEALTNVWQITKQVIKRMRHQKDSFVQLIPTFLVGILSAIWLRTKLSRAISGFDNSALKIGLTEAFLRVATRYALWLFPLLCMSILSLLREMKDPGFSNLSQLLFIVTGYTATLALISLVLAPKEGYARILTIRKQVAIPMTRSLRALVTLSTIGGIFYLFLRKENIAPEIVSASRLFAITVFNLNALVFFIMLARARAISSFTRLICHFLCALFIVALISAWLGYLNFCEFFLLGALGTALAGLLLWFLGQLSREVFDGLDLGTRQWHQHVRSRLAIKQDEHIPGLIWFRLIAIGLVWSLAVVIFLRGWGLSVTGLVLLRKYVFDGFNIGEVTIVPIKIALGVLFFATILLISRLVKGKLSDQSVLLSRLEPSARETLITLTGYLGFIVALLIGLSLAGISFQNVAIVAGALSVGIGFGLQNIVNNFVSGIILLFERPIRNGDWVVVGGTEGFVKRISVRATLIETFDRSDVIVPNSELISSQVTNWTLSNAYGRVIVPVGVAYGSDTKKVHEILMSIAETHPMVIQKNNFFQVPEPIVLFQSFGASSLDFELRCFVRDVRKRLQIKSEMNFEIDRIFRENNIEIPFPQRDIHIRNGSVGDTPD